MSDGGYPINVAQPLGEVFSGKQVRFKTGGLDADQTVTWQQAGVNVLDLTASR